MTWIYVPDFPNFGKQISTPSQAPVAGLPNSGTSTSNASKATTFLLISLLLSGDKQLDTDQN